MTLRALKNGWKPRIAPGNIVKIPRCHFKLLAWVVTIELKESSKIFFPSRGKVIFAWRGHRVGLSMAHIFSAGSGDSACSRWHKIIMEYNVLFFIGFDTSPLLLLQLSAAAWRCFDAARAGCKTIIPNILPCFLPNRNRSVTRGALQALQAAWPRPGAEQDYLEIANTFLTREFIS